MSTCGWRSNPRGSCNEAYKRLGSLCDGGMRYWETCDGMGTKLGVRVRELELDPKDRDESGSAARVRLSRRFVDDCCERLLRPGSISPPSLSRSSRLPVDLRCVECRLLLSLSSSSELSRVAPELNSDCIALYVESERLERLLLSERLERLLLS